MDDFIRVPYGSTVHGDEEINAVVEVLKTTTQMSKNVREFEAKVAEKYEHYYGIMVKTKESDTTTDSPSNLVKNIKKLIFREKS